MTDGMLQGVVFNVDAPVLVWSHSTAILRYRILPRSPCSGKEHDFSHHRWIYSLFPGDFSSGC